MACANVRCAACLSHLDLASCSTLTERAGHYAAPEGLKKVLCTLSGLWCHIGLLKCVFVIECAMLPHDGAACRWGSMPLGQQA
jgi:hypothetical protein